MSYEEGVFQLSSVNQSQVISNQNQYDWIFVENRSSWPLAMGTVPTNSGSKPSFPFTIRPLSIGCYPCDPSGDIVFGYAIGNIAPAFVIDGANQPSPFFPVFPTVRNILYKLMDVGTPFVEELYPIAVSLPVPHLSSIGGGATILHEVFNIPGNHASLVIMQGTDVPPDICIVGVQAVITNLGTAASPSNIEMDLVCNDIAGVGEQFTGAIYPFGGLGANPAGPTIPAIIPLPGVLGVQWCNLNPAVNGTVSLAITYFVGMPARYVGGTV